MGANVSESSGGRLGGCRCGRSRVIVETGEVGRGNTGRGGIHGEDGPRESLLLATDALNDSARLRARFLGNFSWARISVDEDDATMGLTTERDGVERVFTSPSEKSRRTDRRAEYEGGVFGGLSSHLDSCNALSRVDGQSIG